VKINVLVFGPLAQRAGCRMIMLDLPDGCVTCRQVRAALVQTVPRLAEVLPGCRLAVNHEYADDDRVVTGQDEVALIGMVSGG